MKKEDLLNIKFTNLNWILSRHQDDYMMGFLDCKKQILELLEKEEEK